VELILRGGACKHAVVYTKLGTILFVLTDSNCWFFKVAFGRKEKKRKREINCTGYYAMYITGHLQPAAVYVPEMLCHQAAAVL
jgi:hypothetical protein